MTWNQRIGQAPVWGAGTSAGKQTWGATTTPKWGAPTAPTPSTAQRTPPYGPPMQTPSDGKMYAGGNPYFNEATGQYAQVQGGFDVNPPSGYAQVQGGFDVNPPSGRSLENYGRTQIATNTSGNMMYANSAPPAFDWRKGAWEVANKWAPQWAQANPWQNITDPKAVVTALSAYTPDRNSGAWAQYNTDIKYLTAGQGNTAMPTWYGIQQPWGQVEQGQTGAPNVGYTPQYAPTFDWSQWGGQTATNPVQTYAGTPAWMNDPSWITNPALASQAEKWAAIMVPWAQTQQNAYQYAQDSNEAQRRYNLDAAWRQATDQFTMDEARRTSDYQKIRDQEEFALGRQQIWGRNQTPNVRWQRNWG